MKKYIIAGVLAAAIIIYVVFTNSQNAAVTAITPSGGTGTSAPSESVNPGAGTAGSGTPPAGSGSGSGPGIGMGNGGMGSGAGGMMGSYKNGAYTGPVTDAIYGQIQVAVTISGGKITAVDVPVYPNNWGHTSEVSSIAIPMLKQEALTAQSANIDVVSGATQTSQGFQESLAAALTQAQ